MTFYIEIWRDSDGNCREGRKDFVNDSVVVIYLVSVS